MSDYTPTREEIQELQETSQAWYDICAHPAFNACYQEERPLLESIRARLDALVEAESQRDDLQQSVTELLPTSEVAKARVQALRDAAKRLAYEASLTRPGYERVGAAWAAKQIRDRADLEALRAGLE